MHPLFEIIKDILAVIGAGCVISTLVILVLCLVAGLRKN
jgi:hypothetical protein